MAGMKGAIKIGMTDEERYEILRDRILTVVPYDAGKLERIDGNDYALLTNARSSGASRILRKIGEDFGIFRDGYTTQDVSFTFSFSRSGLNESLHKNHSGYQNYTKMMTVFEKVIDNSICLEIHGDRYDNPDSNLDAMLVFVSAFDNDNGVTPVLLEVKTYLDKTNSSLYVAVSLSEMTRSRILVDAHAALGDTSYTPRLLNTSLAKLLASVNPADSNLIKYIPDGFLNNEQKAAKQEALRKTAAYIEEKNEKKRAKRSRRNPERSAMEAKEKERTPERSTMEAKMKKVELELSDGTVELLDNVIKEVNVLAWPEHDRNSFVTQLITDYAAMLIKQRREEKIMETAPAPAKPLDAPASDQPASRPLAELERLAEARKRERAGKRDESKENRKESRDGRKTERAPGE